jgi:Gram-negative porin
MDMFGGLTKTSSRIAIAAALGLTLGGFAFTATPAQAADLGGDCCADLEERVAELEATTVRKGNKKVSVTLSGWVVKSMNVWDDGDESHFVVGDKDYDLGSRFAITGSATIAPGWTAGFNITVNIWANCFSSTGLGDQADDLSACVGADRTSDVITPFTGNNYGGIATLYSYIYIKSDTWGALNWGHLSPASDNPAVLADISGTVIESNGVFFEGSGFLLRPGGRQSGPGTGLSGVRWADFLRCQGLGAGIGVDCWGVAQPAVRYDSPTWGGFRFEASYGKNQLTGPIQSAISPVTVGNDSTSRLDFIDSDDEDFADIAVFYTADWNSIKVSAAAAYTWIETAVRPLLAGLGPVATVPLGSTQPVLITEVEGGVVEVEQALLTTFGPGNLLGRGTDTEADLFQVGGSIMHKPSGLGIYGMYQHEETGGENFVQTAGPNLTGFVTDEFRFFRISNPDTDAWYVKPFWRKAWWAAGATVLYGEFGQYEDQFGAGEINFCAAGFLGRGGNLGNFCTDNTVGADFATAFVTGSEVERFGLGIVQEIDAAAMHLWARWQHQELNDLSIVGFSTDPGNDCFEGCRVKQGFDDWDLFQIGGVIFF